MGHTGEMLQDVVGLPKVWEHSALQPLRLARRRRRRRRLCLAYSSRLAAELLLSGSSHWLLLLRPSQGALLQRLWTLCGLQHSLAVRLAVLSLRLMLISPIYRLAIAMAASKLYS